MSDGLTQVYAAIDAQHADESAHTRRQIMAGAAATLGGLGLLGLPSVAGAAGTGGDEGIRVRNADNSPQAILNIAATAEILATIVNTVGAERNLAGDAVTQRNIAAAAREELIHYKVLVSLGAKPLTRTIYVPDAVFASRANLLNTLQVGDQIFINAYLLATQIFGQAGQGRNAAVAAEFMGVEAVHRALARQSLGLLGNDRVFMRYDQKEEARDSPAFGQPGFDDIQGAVIQLQQAGFGFGKPGSVPGTAYKFDEVSRRTPDDPDLNTKLPNTR